MMFIEILNKDKTLNSLINVDHITLAHPDDYKANYTMLYIRQNRKIIDIPFADFCGILRGVKTHECMRTFKI